MLTCKLCGNVCEHQDIQYHVDQCFETVLCDSCLAVEDAALLDAVTSPEEAQERVWVLCGDEDFYVDVLVEDTK